MRVLLTAFNPVIMLLLLRSLKYPHHKNFIAAAWIKSPPTAYSGNLRLSTNHINNMTVTFLLTDVNFDVNIMNMLRDVKFYKTSDGYCPVQEFIESLSAKAAQKVTWTLTLLEEQEFLPNTYFKKLVDTDGIWEVRIS
jgi:hypothetical protein